MPTAQDDLESFHKFASERLASGGASASLDELLMLWHDLHERDAINESIRRGIADVDAGRFRPAGQSSDSLRHEFGSSKE